MIKRLLQRKDILFNTSHVFINKGLNAVVPVLLLPYFTKVFGVESFGILVYIQSVMILLMFVTDYGFNVTGTRDVSIKKEDPYYVSEVVSTILVVKVILAIICYVALFLYLRLSDVSFEHSLLYVLTFSAFFLQSVTPYWFFQGIKSNWIITTINLVSKVLLVTMVFLFIREGSSLLLVPVFEGLSYAVSFLASIVIIFFFLKIRFRWPSLPMIIGQLRTGRHIFLFSLYNWSITGGAIVAVEYYLSLVDLGYYGTFSRLVYYSFAIVQPINQAIFPYISERANAPGSNQLDLVTLAFKIYAFVVFSFIIGAFLLAEPLFNIFFDEKFEMGLAPYLPVFYLLIIYVSLVMINYFIGLQVLVAFRRDRVYSRSYFVNTVIAVLGFLILIPKLGLTGVPIAMILGELVLLGFLYISFSKLKNDLVRKQSF